VCTGPLGSASPGSNDYVGNMGAAFFSYHFVVFDMGAADFVRAVEWVALVNGSGILQHHWREKPIYVQPTKGITYKYIEYDLEENVTSVQLSMAVECPLSASHINRVHLPFAPSIAHTASSNVHSLRPT